MNDYVAGGYGALAAILVCYVVHLRHRARVLARALPPGKAVPLTPPPRWPEDDPESSDAGTVPDPVAEARALLANAGRPRRRQWLGSRRRQASAGVVLLAAVGFLAYQGLTSATEYFQTTRQAVAHRASLGTKTFRIEGTVERNVRHSGTDLRFTIYGPGQAVSVLSSGSPPQLFKPGIPVVLVGHWQGDTYMSDQIMVKHTASYTEAHPDRVKARPAPVAAVGG